MVIEKNPLLQRAKDMEEMLPYWDMTDTIVKGSKAIKAARETYLPKFPDEQTGDYNFRLQMAKFTNIYRDVLEGLSSKPFEEEITVIKGTEDIPSFVTDFVEDVDGFGSNITTFASLTFFNGINSAIDWIFVDHPSAEGTLNMSVSEARKKNIKPFWTHVLGRNVYEVKTKMVGSKKEIYYFRLFEPSSDGVKANHIRVFELVNDVVTWTLYEEVKDAKKTEDQVKEISSGVLSVPVIPFVPFTTGRKDGNTFAFAPPMLDAADLQITLYQDESGLQHIKAMAGYPMLAANGMKPAMSADNKTPKKVSIGPMRVLYGIPDGNGGHGEWKFIEPNANSMEFLKKDIAATKQDLRELGRQPLTALSAQLTTVTTSIAAGKAKSAVTAWALGLKDSLQNALIITAMYVGSEYKTEVNIYTGFDNVTDDGSDLDALNAARDRGDLSQQTYWQEYKRRKVLSPEFNAEDEERRLFEEIPVEEYEDETLTQLEPDGDGATIG